LTEYVEGYERHITHGTKPDKVVVYKIIPQKGAAVDESSIAYRGNGVVIAAVETQTN